ncbi:hypothetical protein [Sandaracinus amylolyticus]|uniref:hypothetical protein n=1 Tax=Sandaracinus amylolyticus TaxID=927083 RepID=UPI001F1C8A7A|nr:hypothetical protein [Sandaracinus amylolyticus]UJR81596.1 Hypothetical protein I5071_36560 [Sandaracinus amylolyticus]
MRSRTALLVLFVVASLTGCTDRTGGDPLPPFDAGTFDGGSTTTTDSGPRPDSGPQLSNVLIYAHSRDVLFTFSPYTNTVEEIGPFMLPGDDEPTAIIDLAVNADGEVYVAGYDALFRVDPETAALTRVGDFDVDESFFALTFLGEGVIRPVETLIGATNEGVYHEIDRSDASTQRLGQYPDGWISSGDIVSVGGRAFATLKDPENLDAPDVLAEITFDASGRSTVRELGSTWFRQLFGLGSWGDSLYGFSNSGELVRLDPDSGSGTIVSIATGIDSYWGAGVTTRAPILF